MKREMRRALARESFEEKIRKVGQLIALTRTFPRRKTDHSRSAILMALSEAKIQSLVIWISKSTGEVTQSAVDPPGIVKQFNVIEDSQPGLLQVGKATVMDHFGLERAPE